MAITENMHIIVILGSIFLAFGWLFSSEYFPYSIDAAFHLRFSKVFMEAALEKGGYPDWDAPVFDGCGCASFRYYAPLVYIITWCFQSVGVNETLSIKLTLLLFTLVAVYGLRKWFEVIEIPDLKNIATGIFLASAVLTVFIYRVTFLQNICAFMLFPLFLKFLSDHEKNSHIKCALVFGTICFTHVLAGYMIVFASIVLALVFLLIKHDFSLIRRLAFSIAAGSLLASIYLLPALFTADEVHLKLIKWSKNHVIASAGTIPGFLNGRIEGSLFDILNRNTTTSVTVLFLIAAVFTLFAFMLAYLNILSSGKKPEFSEMNKITLISGLGIAFLTLSQSMFLWKIIPEMLMVQYPYRWTFIAFILLLPSLATVWRASLSNGKVLFNGLIIVLFVFPAVLIQYLSPFYNSELTRQSLEDSQHYPVEYLPATWNSEKEIQVKNNDFHRMLYDTSKIKISITEKNQESLGFNLEGNSTGETVIIRTHFDNGWEMINQSDKQLIPLRRTSEGYIEFFPPEKNSQLQLTRKSPDWRLAGLIISLATLIFCLAGFLKPFKN
ncbi:MAG: hypothetical protein HQM10_04160 [Candidatus Riflebacteria bacterium]|nr:hypothetical protein [Candidatus Riflebacteria bacterium]